MIGKVILGTTAKNVNTVQMLDKGSNHQYTVPWYTVSGIPAQESGNPSHPWLTPLLEYTILIYNKVR